MNENQKNQNKAQEKSPVRQGKGLNHIKHSKGPVSLSSLSPLKSEATSSVGATKRHTPQAQGKQVEQAPEGPTEVSPSRRKKMDKTGPSPGKKATSGYERAKATANAIRKNQPLPNSTDRDQISNGEKKSSEPINNSSMTDSSILSKNSSMINYINSSTIDVAEVPKNDAEIADWLAFVLKDPDGAKCWQKYITTYGAEIIKTGLERLNKRLEKGQEIRNPAAYLNTIIKSIIWERQRER